LRCSITLGIALRASGCSYADGGVGLSGEKLSGKRVGTVNIGAVRPRPYDGPMPGAACRGQRALVRSSCSCFPPVFPCPFLTTFWPPFVCPTPLFFLFPPLPPSFLSRYFLFSTGPALCPVAKSKRTAQTDGAPSVSVQHLSPLPMPPPPLGTEAQLARALAMSTYRSRRVFCDVKGANGGGRASVSLTRESYRSHAAVTTRRVNALKLSVCRVHRSASGWTRGESSADDSRRGSRGSTVPYPNMSCNGCALPGRDCMSFLDTRPRAFLKEDEQLRGYLPGVGEVLCAIAPAD